MNFARQVAEAQGRFFSMVNSTAIMIAVPSPSDALQDYRRRTHAKNVAWARGVQYVFACVLVVLTLGYLLEELRLLRSRKSTKKSNVIYRRVRNVHNNLSSWSVKLPIIHSRVYAPIGILGLGFTGFLVCGLLADTPDVNLKHQFDLRSIAKRSGFLGVACLPMLFILSLKNSPIGLLIGSSHEKLNIVHRWVGRIVIGVIGIHAVAYTILFARFNMLLELLRFRNNLYGIIAFAMMLLIAMTSMAIARRKAYEYFFILHWIFTLAVLVFSWLHDHNAVPYINASVLIIGADLVLRLLRVWSSSSSTNTYLRAQVSTLNADWVIVIVGRPESGSLSDWIPGTHAFLNIPGISMHQRHPFTIASIPEDGHLKFFVKKQRGFTQLLHRAQDTAYKCLLDGPYGSLDVTRFAKYPNVLLIGGGVGLAFVLPIMKSLLVRPSFVRTVTFIWSTNNLSTYEHILHELEALYEHHVSSDSQIALNIRTALTGISTETDFSGIDPARPPLSQSNRIEKKGVGQTENLTGESSMTRHNTRFDARDLFQEFKCERLAVGVCGPNGLVLDTRRAVSGVRQDRDIWLHTEDFDW